MYYVLIAFGIGGLKKIFSFLLLAGLMLAVAFTYGKSFKQISFVEPVILRVEGVLDNIGTNNIDAALSGRQELSNKYLEMYSTAPLATKIVGSANYVSSDAGNYSHNSYIDMLNYSGIVGCALFGGLQGLRLYQYRRLKSSAVLAAVKGVILLTAGTVSIFSAQYWLIWFFM